MSDLIDRQKAIDALTRTMVSIPTAGGKDLMHDENRIRMEDILIIKRLPSAEPKKGKWISEGQKNKGLNFWMHCSLCGYKTIDAPSSRTNFCPNCGADMRGEGDDS